MGAELEIMAMVSARLVIIRAVLARPWAKALLYIWAIIAVWDTLVAQLLPPEVSEKAPSVYVVGHKVLSVMSGWFPWWGWVIGLLLILLAISIEYGVRVRLGGRPNSEASTRNETSIIRMTVGESGPYFKTGGGPYDIRRTFKLKMENIDRRKSLTDCSIHIMEVAPPTDYEGPWLLKEGLSLAAGDHVFITLVTYGEAREPDKYPSGETFMTMGTANGRLCLDVGKKFTVTMRATAPETAFCEFQCKIWVGDKGQLRIEGA